jgi:hypothetical protein
MHRVMRYDVLSIGYDRLTEQSHARGRRAKCATRRGSSVARRMQIGVHENQMHSPRCMIDAEQGTIPSSVGR